MEEEVFGEDESGSGGDGEELFSYVLNMLRYLLDFKWRSLNRK